MSNDNHFDAIIIGGSIAGLSAATLLGRARHKVLVLDAGEPCNRFTPHSHSFLTRDGEAPAGLLSIAKAQLENYPTIVLQQGKAMAGHKEGDMWRVETADKQSYLAPRLLLATGV